jgi:hypothetical protein
LKSTENFKMLYKLKTGWRPCMQHTKQTCDTYQVTGTFTLGWY